MMQLVRFQREARHETGENQRCGPGRVAKRQATKSQPQCFKNEGACTREEKNAAKNRNAATLRSHNMSRVSLTRHLGF